MPFAFTNYLKGDTAAIFLKRLNTYLVARQTRDRALSEAEQLTGMARAKKLHSAIQAIAPLLGTIDERQDDPLLAFYGDVVEEIRRLDADNSSGLRKVYDERIAAQKQWQQRESIIKELSRFKRTKEDYPEAIAYIEQILPNIPDDEMRLRLETARQVYLEWDGQYTAALDNVRRLLNDPKITADQRDHLLDREAYNLARLGRIDEMAAHYDRRIVQATDRPAARYRLLHWKASMLRDHDEPEKCIAAYREYRSATEPSSEEWTDATWGLAMVLAREEQHREACTLYEELLKQQPNVPALLLDNAQSQQALGLLDDARKSLDRAEEVLSATFASRERRSDRKAVERFEKRIGEIRELIGRGAK